MYPMLLSYRSPPPFHLIPLPNPAAFTPEVSGNPSRLRRRGNVQSALAVSTASTMLTNLATTPPLPNYNYIGHVDGVDEVDGDQDEDDFVNGKSKQGPSHMLQELGLDDKYAPLSEYLITFGLDESDFISICERRSRLPTDIANVQKRLEFLVDVGVKKRDVKRILKQQPQILEYSVEKNLKPHVAFLRSIGIPESRIGSTICAAPALFSYSIELSLEPAVKYMIEEIGIKPNAVGKVVQLSPDTLFQPTGVSWNARLSFLSKELHAPRNGVLKMVTAHPQLLHYSIEDGIKPRIDFFRSIGMRDSEILKILTSVPQVLSLSIQKNLRPKCLYLANDLRNGVHSLTKYPKYLSLSLDQRIRPRHRFLVSIRKRFRRAPFPLSSFLPSDERFCKKWAGTSLEKYLAFRRNLLLRKK